MREIILLFLCFISVSTFGQEADSIKSYVQFSGRIVQIENGKPIPGVRITNMNRSTMAISNRQGVFTIVVAPEDKVQLTHIGMKNEYVTIPAGVDSKIYREFALAIDEKEIEEVLISGLPPIDELSERLMALNIEEDPDRSLALRNPDTFNILDTIIAHEPSLLAIRNGEIQSSPISWFYERVYKKIKAKVPKPKRKEVLPKFKDSNKEKN